MKKIPIFLLILLFSIATFAQKQQVKVPLKATTNSFKVLNKGSQNLTVKSSIAALYFTKQDTRGGDFTMLETNGLIKVFNMGNPNIPVITNLIEVPQDAEVVINIVSYDEEIINLSDYGITHKIIPAQRSIFKDEDPNDVPFAYNAETYNTDEYFNTKIAVYEESGMLRATRMGRLEISPIQYNPVKNQLRVLNNLVVEINFVGANISKTRALKEKYASPYFDNMLAGRLLNYDNQVSKELIIQTPVEYVIVSDRMFEAQLEPFIAWKEQKGFNVTVGYTDDIGTSTSAIKSWLQDIYESADPMSFVNIL